MTRELIIEGQHVDLAPDTDITLEFVNNIIGDIGKINLSRSYTVKIPKTIRNTRILDDPGRPGHESGVTRRFLNARYYRNGIDLIGPAQAYILKTTPESYEIALVWNTLEALQALSQYSGTLNDLPNLPVLTWIGPNGTTPDYTGGNDKDGAIFAFYNSGLGGVKYPTVNVATHPSMKIGELLNRIINKAGVPCEISNAAQNDIKDLVILAAPKHNPAPAMEYESGGRAQYVALQQKTVNDIYMQGISIGQWDEGWDAPKQYGSIPIAEAGSTFGAVMQTGDNDKHRILLNLKAPVNMEGSSIYVQGLEYNKDMNKVTARETLLEAYFMQDTNGSWYISADEELSLSGWPYYGIALNYAGYLQVTAEFTAYDPSKPKISVHRVHNQVNPAKDNRFPIQGNLPDIKQWDLVKTCMAMFGWAAVIQNGTLHLLKFNELLNTSGAYNWTAKVDMTDGDPQEFGYTLDNWAQINTLKFQEDTPVGFDPNARLEIQDATLPEQRDFFDLPFAASQWSDAPHYKIKEDNKVEDIDIAPRIFRVLSGNPRTLRFTDSLHSHGLIAAHYARFQEVIRKPVTMTVNIRLHEIDLAQLDLTRAVYLGQYGKYYMILKIQTSDTDLCKVQLLQLP